MTSRPDIHDLYAAAVQSVDADMNFVTRVYRGRHGRKPIRLREDFCGTAQLACAWAARDRINDAWGVDLDRGTLEWGRDHVVRRLGDASRRVHLICDDVLTARTPDADAVVAFNFSYCVFKRRAMLRAYFENVRRNLAHGGIFFLDLFGGAEALQPMTEARLIRGAVDSEGRRMAPFTFTWEHERFNTATHEIRCHIHFKLKDGTRLRRAFTYDWRLWTLPELRDLLAECGFAGSDVYTHGWDADGDSDGIFRKVKQLDNAEGWLAYVVAYT